MNQPLAPFHLSENDLTAALEREPAVSVAADFASRVALRASILPAPRPRTSRSYGRLIASVSAAVLVVAMFLLATQVKASFTSLAFDLELLLVVQLMGIAWWLTTSRVRNAA